MSKGGEGGDAGLIGYSEHQRPPSYPAGRRKRKEGNFFVRGKRRHHAHKNSPDDCNARKRKESVKPKELSIPSSTNKEHEDTSKKKGRRGVLLHVGGIIRGKTKFRQHRKKGGGGRLRALFWKKAQADGEEPLLGET